MTSKVKPHSTKLKNCIYYFIFSRFKSASTVIAPTVANSRIYFNLLLPAAVANDHNDLGSLMS
jgi:hypothetical protein